MTDTSGPGFDRSFDALTELLRDVSETDVAIPALSTAPFAPAGQIYVGGELITYTSLGTGPVGEAVFNVTRDPTVSRPHTGGEKIWQQRAGLMQYDSDAGRRTVRPRAVTEYAGNVEVVEYPNENKNLIVVGNRGDLVDELNGGVAISGYTGNTNGYISATGSGAVVLENSRYNAPGIYRITTGGTSGSTATMYWGDIWLQDIDEFEFIIVNLGANTSMQTYVGFADVLAINSRSVGVLAQPPTTPNFTGYIDTTAAAATFLSDSGVALMPNMPYKFLYKRIATNALTCTVIGNSQQGTVTISGFDTDSSYFPMVRLINNAAEVKECWIDYIRRRARPMLRVNGPGGVSYPAGY